MARNMYGATSADFTVTAGGRPVPSVELTIWDARTGGTQITDLLDVDSAACTTITSGADGSVVFYGPDGENDTLWLESGIGSRLATRPTVLTAEIADGSILDEDINAAANIDRTKIAGTALTAESMSIFNVKDYGAVGDNTADDTAAIQAALTAATGAVCHFPPGRYKCSGTLTVPAHTAMRGSIIEMGQGGTGVTELIFPATGSVTAITCTSYATIERLLIRGPGSGTSTGIASASTTLRDVSIVDFTTCVALTNAYYAHLDRVEFSRYTTGLSMSGCYNVNLYSCRFSHNNDATGAVTAISTGTVRSLNIFGGSIENYTRALQVAAASGIRCYGVYFETALDGSAQSINGLRIPERDGVSVVLSGCTIYLNNTDEFLYMANCTNSDLTAHGNLFASAATSLATQAYRLPTETSNHFHISNDNWSAVADSAVSYVGDFVDAGPAVTAHIEMPVAYTSGAYTTAAGTTAFVGRNPFFAEGSHLRFGGATGTKIGNTAGQKMGFWGKTPVVQPSANADTSGASLGDLETEVNQLKALLRSIGLMAT